MPEHDTLTAALEHFDAIIPANIRQCWSALSNDGSVIGQFWRDQFVAVYGRRFYIGEPVNDPLADRPGFQKWREHLNIAWRRPGRNIRVIEVTRGSPNRFRPRDDIEMRLLALDQETGAFVAREEPA
jgi:hypothetical protein